MWHWRTTQCLRWAITCYISNRFLTSLKFNLIQFNSKTLFKDGDPVSSQLIFPGAIQKWLIIGGALLQYLWFRVVSSWNVKKQKYVSWKLCVLSHADCELMISVCQQINIYLSMKQTISGIYFQYYICTYWSHLWNEVVLGNLWPWLLTIGPSLMVRWKKNTFDKKRRLVLIVWEKMFIVKE